MDRPKRIRQADAASINEHDTSERGQATEEPLRRGEVPDPLHRLVPIPDVDQIDRALTEGLVRDQPAMALDVLHFGNPEHLAKVPPQAPAFLRSRARP